MRHNFFPRPLPTAHSSGEPSTLPAEQRTVDAVQTQMQELGTEVMLESMELVQLAADEDSANRRVSIDDSSKSPAVGSAMDYGGGLDLGLNDETRGYDGPDLRNLREILDFDPWPACWSWRRTLSDETPNCNREPERRRRGAR